MSYQFMQQFIKKNISFRKFKQSYFSSSTNNIPKSSLFISGERAVDTFVSVVPHLNFDDQFVDLKQIEENVKKRKLDLNVGEMKESWDFYKEWNGKKLKLQENLNEATKKFDEISKSDEKEKKKTELGKLKIHKDFIKEQLQYVKKNVWSMEDTVICNLLQLPNVLHSETPAQEESLFEYHEEKVQDGIDHLLIGAKLDFIEYKNELSCFLKNKAALFELAVAELFAHNFTEQNFVRFSNPDFTRSVLAEGVGLVPNECSELFILDNSENNNERLHLCGGASLFPFCGFHAKQTVPKHSLPVKYVTFGRRYTPVTNSLPGLYSVKQSTSVQIFTATCSEEEMYFEFQSCVKILQDLLRDLGLRFKMAKQPPFILKRWESLRVSIKIYSPVYNDFVEVGYVSLVDDYVSKRLRMCYTDKKDELFLKVVCGTVMNAQTLLALCLERSNSDLFIPEAVKDFMIR